MIGLLINVCSVPYYAVQTLQLSQATELCPNSHLYGIPSLPPLFLTMEVVIDSDMSNYITHRLAWSCTHTGPSGSLCWGHQGGPLRQGAW